jgi:hypothetical protein
MISRLRLGASCAGPGVQPIDSRLGPESRAVWLDRAGPICKKDIPDGRRIRGLFKDAKSRLHASERAVAGRPSMTPSLHPWAEMKASLRRSGVVG